MPRLRILVSGMIAGDPAQGGATWAVLQYLLGLQALGHDVAFVEPVTTSQIRPENATLGSSANAAYLDAVMRQVGWTAPAALLQAGTRETTGMSYARLREFAGSADLLINISGLLTDDALLGAVDRRVYVDLDPAFNQLWHAEGIDRHFDAHTHFATIGPHIGHPGCDIPTCGRTWVPIRQPVVLGHWPSTAGDAAAPLTTIANWRAYGSITWKGVMYGQKVHSMRPFFQLPTQTSETFLLALAIHPGEVADLAALSANRWQLCDPAVVAAMPSDYQAFVQASKAEFGIAKSGYVLSRCGWFSDRSVCYLASGRPVIAQSTGFEDYIPTGEGLFAFSTVDDVMGALDRINSDYPRHCRRAREVAEDCFDSGRVLRELLAAVGAP